MKQFTLLLASMTFISLVHARALAACGTVEVSKGDVKIQAANSPALKPADVGAKICSGDTIVSGKDSRAKLKMEDGNELNVSPDSKIVLETYLFNPATNKKKVLLNVIKGKIRAATKQENMYNDKAKDGQANTFRVRTKTAVAGVRGTDFLTSFDPKTSKSEVITFKGQVEVGQLGPSGSIKNAVKVNAGQKTEAMAGKPPAPPVVIAPVELESRSQDSKPEGASEGAAKQNAPAPEQGARTSDGASTKGEGSSSGAAVAPASPAATETSASTGATSGSSASSTTSTSTGTSTPASAPTAAPTRTVASTAPPLPSGSMLSGGDIVGTSAPVPIALPASPGALMPTAVQPIVVPPRVPVLPPLPVCDFCNRAIQTGPGRLNIRIGYEN